MPDFPKAPELFRTFRDEVVSRSQKLSVNAVDRDGSDSNLMGWGGAAMAESVIGQLAATEEGFWLDSSTGAKLDKWAWDRYRMTRKPASPAFVTVAFSTTAGAPNAFTIPATTKVATSDGIEFLTVVSTPFPLGATGPILVLARSTLAGLDQNIASATVKSITSQVPSSPTDLAVTNPDAAAGGDTIESDDNFKDRIRRFWVAARRGTRGAIETGALAVPGVRNARAIEGLTGAGYPARSVQLVIADAFTDALVRTGVDVPSYDLKSQAFAKTVALALEEYRGYGVPVRVVVGQFVLVQVALRLRFRAGIDDPDSITLYARTLVTQYINSLDPGATFDPAAVSVILQSVPGLAITGDEVASPPGPIIPGSPYQVLRTALANITADPQASFQSAA